MFFVLLLNRRNNAFAEKSNGERGFKGVTDELKDTRNTLATCIPAGNSTYTSNLILDTAAAEI
jgi:hypothetical protein